MNTNKPAEELYESDDAFEDFIRQLMAEADKEEIELPFELEINFDSLELFAGEEINDENVTKWIKKYLRKTYKHCLARNSAPNILIDDKLYVSDIEWGRPLSQSELDALDY